MPDIYGFSEDERRRFLEFFRDYTAGRLPRERSGQWGPPAADYPAPDVYVALTGPAGIPALILAGGTGGTGLDFDEPGEALCDIYRVVENETAFTGTGPGRPELHEIESFQKRVYNLSRTAVEPDTYFLAIRSKQGVWFAAVGGAGGGGAEVTATVVSRVTCNPGGPIIIHYRDLTFVGTVSGEYT